MLFWAAMAQRCHVRQHRRHLLPSRGLNLLALNVLAQLLSRTALSWQARAPSKTCRNCDRYSRVLGFADTCVRARKPVTRTQVHQFLLECKLRGADVAKCGEGGEIREAWDKRRRMARAVFEARSRNRAMPSLLHSSIEVSFSVALLGLVCAMRVYSPARHLCFSHLLMACTPLCAGGTPARGGAEQ